MSSPLEGNTMTRPTADDMYARAKAALDSAEAVAGNPRASGTVHDHLVIAAGFQSLAESLADRERGSRRPGGSVVVNAAGMGPRA